MNQSQPAWGPQDEGHLNLLSIFYYIFAGLGLLGGCFLIVHYLIMNAVMSGQMGNSNGQQPPQEIFMMMKVLYVVVAFFMVVGMALNILTAVFLRRRKHRIFSMVIAGLNCLQFPFGTVLGVFTFVVLMRESVRESYERLAQEN